MAGANKRKKSGESLTRKAKKARQVPNGRAVITTSFNNTKIVVTSPNGEVLTWSSAGKEGFKGAYKNTPFAAQKVAETCAKHAVDVHGMKALDEVRVKGPGAGRESAVRALNNAGLQIKRIIDATPLPHNGCRPSKKRRV